MSPLWLHALSIVELLTGAGCALAITVDVTTHPQHIRQQTIANDAVSAP